MLKPTSFLLVDDDQDDNFVFQSALSEVAPTVKLISALNGQEAFSILQQLDKLPDIIFLDLNMPVMDGKEFLSMVKATPAFAKISVIMYTTSSQSADIEETLQHGAICFITKPDNVKELKSILSAISSSTNESLYKTLQKLSNESTAFIVC